MNDCVPRELSLTIAASSPPDPVLLSDPDAVHTLRRLIVEAVGSNVSEGSIGSLEVKTTADGPWIEGAPIPNVGGVAVGFPREIPLPEGPFEFPYIRAVLTDAHIGTSAVYHFGVSG